ncbi:MAG TPA: S8 family serine peptidase [Cytophagales bacterium]
MKNFLITVLASLTVGLAGAQPKYWISFTDKPDPVPGRAYVSEAAVRNRQLLRLPVCQPTDVPVSAAYLARLRQLGVRPVHPSKWLNATSAYLDARQRAAVQALPFVREVTPITVELIAAGTPEPEFISTVLTQVGGREFIANGLTGKDVKVGVIDVGFYGLTTNRSLGHLLQEERIKDVRDFVTPSRTEHFTENETHSDYHGAEVLQMLTGYDPDRKMQYGLATGAHFYLARTDHGIREARTEEDNWIAAVERLDSLGVRLVNTSLGYALGFSNPKENYKPSEMNGHTSKISRAAQVAAEEKGMLIVVSAGNEGDDARWRIVSTPADAQGVLSVGATKAKSRDKMSYSSIGPDFLPYLKPNVSCFAPNGTSFAAPVITGFAACLIEKNPALTNRQLMRIIEKSAHLYPYGNTYVGYGVPDARKALALAEDSTATVNVAKEVRTKGNSYAYQVTQPDAEKAVVFHKKNATVVLRQELLVVDAGKLTIRREPGETRTTLDLGTEIVEVFWE